jgi:hypothetical protein
MVFTAKLINIIWGGGQENCAVATQNMGSICNILTWRVLLDSR